MNRKRQTSTRSTRVYLTIFALLVGALLFGLVGAEATTNSDISRTADISVVQQDSGNAIVSISPEAAITDNTTNQQFVTITNQQTTPVDYTVTLPSEVTTHVSFRSTLSTTAFNDGASVDTYLESGESAVLFVDVAPNASQYLSTATLEVSGVDANQQRVFTITNDGPSVVK